MDFPHFETKMKDVKLAFMERREAQHSPKVLGGKLVGYNLFIDICGPLEGYR